MIIEELIEQIKILPECSLKSSMGMPQINNKYHLPDDIQTFYSLCGGANLFLVEDKYGVEIVEPTEFTLANPEIIGEVYEEDITSSWYIIAHTDNGEYLTIDLSEKRFGKCYDSHYEVHGVPGSCPIIALSFTELIFNLISAKGKYWQGKRKKI